MKAAIFTLFLSILLVDVQAQQVPRAATTDQVPGELGKPPISLQVPRPIRPDYASKDDDTQKLLRAQTEAIKALSEKLDQLETRISKLEGRGGR